LGAVRREGAFVLSLAALAVGVALGRALEMRERTPALARSASPPPRSPAAPDRVCGAVRAELATAKARLGICLVYAQPAVEVPREGGRELVLVEDPDGSVSSYPPDAWPPGGVDLDGDAGPP
jgi:hypothetical protein